MNPRTLLPGQQYTATELNELARQVAQSSRITGSGNLAAVATGLGTIYRDLSDEAIYARITGSPTGAKYPYVEVVRNSDGTTTDITAANGGRHGTATDTPAVELTGSTTVPTNTIVQLTPLPGGGGWGFVAGVSSTWSATTAGSLTTVAQTGAGYKTSVPGTDATLPGWGATVTTTEFNASPTPSLGWPVYNANWSDTTLGSNGFAVTLIKGTVLGIDQIYATLRAYSGAYTLSLPTISLCRNGASSGIVLAGFPSLSGVESSFAVHRSGVLRVGATATVSGLTFAGGLYISGSVTAPAVGDITGLGTGVATWLATPSSANLAAAVTDETGTGALVFANAPTLVDPVVGTQTAGDNSTKAASTAYVDSAVSTAVAGTTVSLSYDAGTNVLTVTVNGVSDTIDLSDLA